MRKYLLSASVTLFALSALAASSFTTHYNLEKPKDGSTNWGPAIRDNMDKIDTQMSVTATSLSNHVSSSTAHPAGKISITTPPSLCLAAQNAQEYLDCLDTQMGAVLLGGAVTLSSDQSISGQKTFTNNLIGTGGFDFSGLKKFSDLGTGLLKSDATGTISSGLLSNADIDPAAGIAYSKLTLSGGVVDADISASAAIADTKLATIQSAGKVANSATTATAANTGSAIVARDTNGNFSAGTITASSFVGALSGNAATATSALTAGTLTGSLSGDVTSVGMVTSISALPDSKLATISTAGKVANSATSAASSNTASAIVARDASGNFSAGTITAASFVGDLNGTASSATTALSANTATSATTATNFSGSLAGDVTGTQGATVISNLADSKLATIATAGKVSNSATTATSANTASAIVARDASGNFSAGTISAALNGNATTATSATSATTATTATSFSGALSGDVTGNQGTTVVGKIKGVTVDDAAKADGKALVYKSASGNLEYSTVSATATSGAFKNFVANPSGATNALNWTLTNGSGTGAFIRDTTAGVAIGGNGASLKFTAAGSGDYVTSDAMTLDNDVTGSCEVQMSYTTSATVYSVSLMNGTTVLNTLALPASSTYRLASFNYPCASGYSIKLSASGSGTAINFGNVYWGKATNLTFGQNTGPWESCTPVFPSLNVGSTGTVSGVCRHVGDSMEVIANFTLGGTGVSVPANLTVRPPSPYAIDTTKVSLASDHGWRATQSSTSKRFEGTMLVAGADVFGVYDNATTNVGTSTPFTWAAGDSYNARFMVPITGWTSEQAVRMDSTPASWTGYLAGADSGVTTSTGFADVTSTGVSVTQLTNTNMGTVASAGTSVYGITFTPPKTGTYRICSTGAMLQATGTNTGSVQIVDGSNSIINPGTSFTMASGTLYAFSLCGDLKVTSLAPVTAKLRLAVASGSTGIQFKNVSAGNSSSWTITQIDAPAAAPLLVGSVTSNSSGLERVERAVLNALSGGCSIVSQSGSWLTGCSRVGVGQFKMTIATGIFSAVPTCFFQAKGNGTQPGTILPYAEVASGDYQFDAHNSTTMAANTGLTDPSYGTNVVCVGPR